MRFPNRTEKNRKKQKKTEKKILQLACSAAAKKINLGIQPRQFLIPFSKKFMGNY